MKKLVFLIIIAFIAFVGYSQYQGMTVNEDDAIESGRNYYIIEEDEVVVTPPQIEFDNTKRNISTSTTNLECNDNPAVCAVDLAVKCTINPNLSFCDKKKLPRFIFMDEEALGRPTKIDYAIMKAHPIDMHTIEIRTVSSCDGSWFGLCNGNIIYVINNSSGEWVVKEIYALDTY